MKTYYQYVKDNSTITDRKLPETENDLLTNYQSDITQESRYYPFGMLMDLGDSLGYRFGYQGSERVDEIAGYGNHYTTFYRGLDVRIGKWLSVDPKMNLIPGESPYSSMGNNPIWFNDPLGDIFEIDTDDEKAKSDVKSLVKSRKNNQQYIEFDNETGEVTLDFGNMRDKKRERILKNDKGLRLIQTLSTATNLEGEEITIFYGTQGETGIGLEMPEMQKELQDIDYYSNISTLENRGMTFFDDFGGYDPRAFILNASTTQYDDANSPKYGLKPIDGYDAKVYIGRGSFKEVVNKPNSLGVNTTTLIILSRASIIYHELSESFLRTAKEYCYNESHQKAGGEGGGEKRDIRFYPDMRYFPDKKTKK